MAVAELTRPRVCSFPDAVGSTGGEAVDLARMAGLELDPWQAFVLENSLGERPDGRWAAFEVGVVVSRQNGKGGILEAFELAGLFLIGERLIIHSAHQFDTSLEAFGRLLGLIEDTPELSRRVRRVTRSHGEEGITLTNGQRIRFRTRTKGGGRGFTCDRLILDEAMILPETAHGALLPTLSARRNPQVIYTGSAVDQLVHEHGVVLARVRERGLRGDDPSLAYFEWSVDASDPSAVSPALAADEACWAAANPALDIRISREHVERERRSMDPRTFAVERLGVGDWPATDGSAGAVIPMDVWDAAADPASELAGVVWMAFDVTPDRGWASIAAAGRRDDGLLHVEVIDRRPGVGWVAGRLRELQDRWRPQSIVFDGASPAASLASDLVSAGVHAGEVGTKEYMKACGVLFDAAVEGRLRHLGQVELDGAVRGAAKRPLVDAWAWSRKSSQVDISPLVAVTLATLGAAAPAPRPWVEAW